MLAPVPCRHERKCAWRAVESYRVNGMPALQTVIQMHSPMLERAVVYVGLPSNQRASVV